MAPVPAFAQEAYAVARNRFGATEFGPEYLSWYLSKPMVRKTLHVLEKSGWIRRTARARYVCVEPEQVFAQMVRLRVPELLRGANHPYVYAGASAVEVWTDFAYVQRSWEHSPYFVKVPPEDVAFWVSYLRTNKVRVFVEQPQPALGEFVVVIPEPALEVVTHEGMPVVPVEEAVRFCESHIEAFEFPLAFLCTKYGVRTEVAMDPRTVEEARGA